MLDPQPAKSHQGGEAIGYDAGKRVRGRDRRLREAMLRLTRQGILHRTAPQR